MKQIVFYSWQSDLPNSCNRGLILEALERAASTIRSDDSIAVEPVIDRDTQGVPGSPEIASTIFSKITAADVFVADVSIIGRSEHRASPNPNVLIELGYAFKAVGHERVVPVFNRAFGKVEELPFDLKMRRVLVYEASPDKAKADARKTLERQLEEALRAALAHRQSEPAPPPIPAVAAIENQQGNRLIVLRQNLDHLLGRLDVLEPKRTSAGGTVDQLMEALSQTQEPVAEFSKIAEAIAMMSDVEMAVELYRWFGLVFERYNLPPGRSGPFSNTDQDFFKFIGHELFVTFIAFLLKEQRWGMLHRVLDEPIPMRYLPEGNGPGNAAWDYASEHLPSLLDESHRRHRLSIHADILNERHTTGGLASIVPMDDFMAADYFLFLLGEIPPEAAPDSFMRWRPWSVLFLKGTPMFLVAAESKRIANEILKLLGISDAEEFRHRFSERASRLNRLFSGGFWTNPVGNLSRFGTR